MMGRGVCPGASTPIQKLNSAPGTPASATVGTSGRFGARFFPLTASAISRPSRIADCAAEIPTVPNWVRPAMVSVIISGAPLSGTCTALIPVTARNFSAFTCDALPIPAEG